MGWLFSTRRDPNDPLQLQIAVHELGHAVVWKAVGFVIKSVVHEGDSGSVDVRWDPDNLTGYVIGCWGGFEAERRWARLHGRSARRTNSSHDIANFHHVNRALGARRLSESKARALARKHVDRHWAQIQRRAPELVRSGRIYL
ncbi:hypothetical protein [Saccharomonospora azurea]|uniref:Uncharacterized protein n=1 Tax=Saccharomonospora azurea NA-128 TaxID=882081 RepID=H8GEU9_9PSEU|nr:hypothetical protein [Saccharomonospora azurea]EHY90010.1 hypothetical protein SacazDRAFT_03129 [Saccharomonospora azurea NA-128]